MSSIQAERQVILLSAGTAARRRAMGARAGRLMVDIDWQRFVETLRRRKLLTILGPRILELADGSASGGLAEAVGQALEAGRRRGALLQLISLRAIAMLADAGIRCAPLKGPLLGEAIYGDPGRRLSGDIDLLVAPEQLQAAVEVVRELGYGAPTDFVGECGLPLLHFVLTHERGELPPVELHWRVHWYERSFASERLLPPSVEVAVDWRPAPADELAALLLFYARDGFVGLRLASDLGAWWDVYKPELPAGGLEELLGAYPALARVLPTAARAAEKVAGAAGGADPRGRAQARHSPAGGGEAGESQSHSSPSQLYADMGLINGLLAPAGGFGAFVRRQLLAAPEVLDQQAEHGAKHRARSRLTRFVGVLARYALRITSLLRASDMAS